MPIPTTIAAIAAAAMTIMICSGDIFPTHSLRFAEPIYLTLYGEDGKHVKQYVLPASLEIV
jgi:hypothetical protein